MRSLPEPSEKELLRGDIQATQIWETVVLSMSQYANDSIHSKFIPTEELLNIIRPVAAAFSTLHYTPIPPLKEIYKSRLYALFYFTIICGVQIYVKQRSIIKSHAPFVLKTDKTRLREAKNSVMKQLTEGIKVYPPVNQIMDLALSHISVSKRMDRLDIKNTEFDKQKFQKFISVTLLWGYLFAKEIIEDR